MGNMRITLATSATNPNLRDLFLDETGQIEWIGFDITDEEDYARMVLQRIHCRLLFIRGEWYLDQRQGTPWRERIWIKGPELDVIRRIAWDVVETTPGVAAVKSVDVSLDSVARTASISIVATTDLDTILSTDDLDGPLIVEIPNV